VEWVGTVAAVSLLLVALLAAGMRVPGATLARAVASRILCAAALADTCRDEPVLMATYGTEIGKLVRHHMPWVLFERRSRAMPVDFRRCRSSACGDGTPRGIVDRTDAGLPVTAFAHVIDCRPGKAEAAEEAGDDCSGDAAGNLYIQYWTYYADSATFRGVPIAGRKGYHSDDWESVQIRIGPDGRIDERASAHDGYAYGTGIASWGAEVGVAQGEKAAELIGIRNHGGWGPETKLLFVAGGSHAGSVGGVPHSDRLVRGGHVHLIPLEPIVDDLDGYDFAVHPPWRKKVWRDPEAPGTD
jgi:hypothetical protein